MIDVGSAVPIHEAARQLGVRPGTVARWVSEGCPVVQRGRRGRGCALLLDVDQVRRWTGADARDAAILELAAAAPELLANSMLQALQQAEGIDKRKLANVLCGAWYVAACSLLDHLRARCPSVPEINGPLPEPVERLRKIGKSV